MKLVQPSPSASAGQLSLFFKSDLEHAAFDNCAFCDDILRHAISEELARKLLAWRHPGFSAHVGEAIPFEDKKAIEDVACYVVRNPLSLKKLVVRRARVNRARLIGRDRFAIPALDGQKAVLYRSKMNPSLGRNFEAMDPLEWLARMADHIPDAGKHRTHFYGFYASRVRASRRETEASGSRPSQTPPKDAVRRPGRGSSAPEVVREPPSILTLAPRRG